MTRALALLLFVVSCAQPTQRPTTEGSFPHPADYAHGTHGVDSLAEGASCLGCHAVEDGQQVQGATPVAPSCRSCHEAFPHEAGYGTTPEHGAAWLAEGSTCADCHGEAGETAPAERTSGQCTACHASFPHPAGWAEASGHGAAVLSRRSPAACLSCHDAEGPAEAACETCHAVYPHPEGWGEPTGHAAAYTAGTSCGTSCHPSDAAAAGSRLTCQGCHDLYPHAEGWPDGHIRVVQSRGEGACATCHDSGELAGGVMPVSCAASCHGAGGTP